MSGKIVPLRQAKKFRNATSLSKGRPGNDAYRVREHLTEAEVDKLLAALKDNRHGHRDWLIGLVIYRHGLRVSEACDLRWDDIDLRKRTIIVRRLKGSTDSVHYRVGCCGPDSVPKKSLACSQTYSNHIVIVRRQRAA
jgi:integrase